ncbi:glycerol-3-phosphate dehydrogenase/oxidase [Ammoniphilus sp. 3BR4]|uniref:glycerol-3-phosphate dehydrogenase/oxidase n=1 Tax=Ammoniphilus sp. 3BR4 TaxID=3158265 RepID=UPI0034671654
MLSFSLKNREKDLKRLHQEEWDLLVIGGGIIGAGIAWDAALRGLKVGLVEKKDFGWGTSGGSAKLIHGGLRYLKQGQLRLLHDVGKERAILHKLAPHLVHPIHMMLPLYRGGSLGEFSTSLGLWIYDRLAGVKKEERRQMLSCEETQHLEPMFQAKNLLGSGYYVEYITNDARLTLDVIRSAYTAGAVCLNYTQALSFHYEENCVNGVIVKDLAGIKRLVKAKKIVNAAGPWADQLWEINKSRRGKKQWLIKDVHIAVKLEKIPIKQPLYFDTQDGRMIFAIPRDTIVYIGATDTLYSDYTDHPTVSREDSRYLLQAIQKVFPRVKLQSSDIISSWAGVRPFTQSRKDQILIASSGLITIAGGRLAEFRKMAQKVVDLICRQLHVEENLSYGPCITELSPIMGGGADGGEGYAEWKKEWLDRVAKAGLPAHQAEEWIAAYGMSAENIIEELGIRLNPQRKISEVEAYEAVLQYSWEQEMICRADDLFIRRTGFLFSQPNRFLQLLDQTIQFLAEKQGWTAIEKEKEGERLIQLYHEATLNRLTLGRSYE